MKFFFDRNISEHLAKMVDAFDRVNSITHQDHDNRFDPKTPDIDLFSTLSSESPQPHFLTADVGQRKNAAERLALAESGPTAVFFRSGFHDLGPHMQAVKMVWIWPSIVEACGRCKYPSIFEVTPKINATKVEFICPTARLAD